MRFLGVRFGIVSAKYIPIALMGFMVFVSACGTGQEDKKWNLYHEGLQSLNLRSFSQALERFDQALKIDPNFPEAYVGRGHALREMRRFGDAEKAFHRALALNPIFLQAQLSLASLYLDRNRLEDAERAAQKALKIDPSSEKAQHILGLALFREKRYSTMW